MLAASLLNQKQGNRARTPIQFFFLLWFNVSLEVLVSNLKTWNRINKQIGKKGHKITTWLLYHTKKTKE